ncbi:MAG: hypothetical protein K0R54_5647 [Clostridiaceae bacterium]|jgi:hypothetical protein|nr:hypothetical protein [Clostridiaceae bacterium]
MEILSGRFKILLKDKQYYHIYCRRWQGIVIEDDSIKFYGDIGIIKNGDY